MTFPAAILAALLAVPRSTLDTAHESDTDRSIRLGAIAVAIETAANRAACYRASETCRVVVADRETAAAMLIVQATRESGLRRDVHYGFCRPEECDRGRARGPWQLHRWPSVSRQEWIGYAGSDIAGVALGAWRVLLLWAGARSRGPGCGFAALAGRPGECSPGGHPSPRWVARWHSVAAIAKKLRTP